MGRSVGRLIYVKVIAAMASTAAAMALFELWSKVMW